MEQMTTAGLLKDCQSSCQHRSHQALPGLAVNEELDKYLSEKT
jgi:hypothetical protein